MKTLESKKPEIPEDKTDMMSIADVAKFFGCKDDYVRTVLIKIKGFPCIRIGKRYFIYRDGLKKWIEKNYGSYFHVI